MTWNRFSPAARQAVAGAEAFARRHGEIARFSSDALGGDFALGFVAADHLLLGVSHPDVRADIWTRLSLDPADVYAALERALAAGEWPPPPTDVPLADRPDPVDVQLDESAQQAMEYAAAEARRLRHPDIRPEHLLLGALRVGQPRRRAPESLGCLVLAEYGVTLESILAAILAADVEAGTGLYAPRASAFEP